jgi:hypothetical protein
VSPDAVDERDGFREREAPAGFVLFAEGGVAVCE